MKYLFPIILILIFTSFRIDHPLDPENKYLQHSFVESPDMLNIYTGNAICGREGVSFVTMPDYFKALNRDYTYHLTPIGEFAHLKVQIEISDCLETVGAELKEYPCFIVSGGYDGLKFSWMVTGIRKDLYAEENRIQVELDKRRPGRIYHSKNK